MGRRCGRLCQRGQARCAGCWGSGRLAARSVVRLAGRRRGPGCGCWASSVARRPGSGFSAPWFGVGIVPVGCAGGVLVCACSVARRPGPGVSCPGPGAGVSGPAVPVGSGSAGGCGCLRPLGSPMARRRCICRRPRAHRSRGRRDGLERVRGGPGFGGRRRDRTGRARGCETFTRGLVSRRGSVVGVGVTVGATGLGVGSRSRAAICRACCRGGLECSLHLRVGGRTRPAWPAPPRGRRCGRQSAPARSGPGWLRQPRAAVSPASSASMAAEQAVPCAASARPGPQPAGPRWSARYRRAGAAWGCQRGHPLQRHPGD